MTEQLIEEKQKNSFIDLGTGLGTSCYSLKNGWAQVYSMPPICQTLLHVPPNMTTKNRLNPSYLTTIRSQV